MTLRINPHNIVLADCETYDDYLNALVGRRELALTRDIKVCRQLLVCSMNNGYLIYTPEEFQNQKELAIKAIRSKYSLLNLYSTNLNNDDLLLQELANREELNLKKTLSTIIFIMQINKQGFEISSYIDYEHNLRIAHAQHKNCRDWAGIFSGKVPLVPKTSDLNYLDWHRKKIFTNETHNYKVLRSIKRGLIFRHKGDLKDICVDIKNNKTDENFKRTLIYSEKYRYVILYDHPIRKKN